jgi:DNA-binding response OmpR family regulator
VLVYHGNAGGYGYRVRINSGARDYILKPFSTPEVLKTFERQSDEYRVSSRGSAGPKEAKSGG